jgi:hypothetical protein
MRLLPAPLALLPFVVLLAACREADAPAPAALPDAPPAGPLLHDAADSLAARIVEGAGGLAAWAALPALRFDFAVASDTGEVSRRHHLWDRRTGRYRLEWTAGDSLLVALFSVERVADDVPEGAVYLDGVPLDSAAARAYLGRSYGRFINDTYWLLAPLKVFDPGVRRGLAPDSADAATDVLTLAFDDVGLTPGDRYWLRADRTTGRLVGWTYALESGGAGTYRWEDARELPTPAGPLRLATRKAAPDGLRAILTPVAPAETDDAAFTDPRPRLRPLP